MNRVGGRGKGGIYNTLGFSKEFFPDVACGAKLCKQEIASPFFSRDQRSPGSAGPGAAPGVAASGSKMQVSSHAYSLGAAVSDRENGGFGPRLLFWSGLRLLLHQRHNAIIRGRWHYYIQGAPRALLHYALNAIITEALSRASVIVASRA